MAEEARLESVYTPKGYQEFESPSLRKPKKENQRQVHLNADFLFPVCTAPPQAAGDVGATANEIPERRRRAGPPAGDVGATANGIPERRRRAGPPTGDVGTTADEISERRRCAGPPAGDVGTTAMKSPREGSAQSRLREMSEHQRTESRREGGARGRLRTRPVI